MLCRSGLAKPELGKPELTKPELNKPELGIPELGKPELPKPELAKPELAKLELAKPHVCLHKFTRKTNNCHLYVHILKTVQTVENTKITKNRIKWQLNETTKHHPADSSSFTASLCL